MLGVLDSFSIMEINVFECYFFMMNGNEIILKAIFLPKEDDNIAS